ncbi:MAG: hypothetical protein OZ921_19715 [Sorangiineae bacterium]|nr:hypothetical protein [Polyangiaceae bacterium]MEB2324753.1 hypothetical protein [Sorangiineae bacterium]
MKAARQLTARIFLGATLACGALAACGGAQESPADATKQEDEGKAARQLARARESKNPDRYRELIARFGDTKAAVDAKDELAAILVEQAEAAMTKKDWRAAESLAEEARQYAGLELTRRAIAVEDEIDQTHAAHVAEAAEALAKEGKCASAAKTVAAPLRKKPRAAFKGRLQKLAGPPLVDCYAKKLAEEIDQGNLDPARAMLATPDATTALSKPHYDAAQAALQKLIVKRSTSQIQPMLAAQDWTGALAELDALEKAGKLDAKEHRVAIGVVQDAILESLLVRAKAGLTAAKPSEVLERFDTDVSVAAWKQLPAELTAARALLTIAVECERLKCKPGAPAKVWAWGSVAIHTPASAEGETVATVKHAEPAWLLAKGAKFALVVREDPGKLAPGELWAKADGWAAPEHLKPADTALWLPPSEQLVGVQVWGPLRPPSKDYHLGVVTKVDGKQATVRRMADSLEQAVPLASLRIGKLMSGTKIMAFCEDELHPSSAKIAGVVTVEGGVPKVKIACDKGGIERVDLGGSITSRAEWLPPRRP